MTMTEFLLARYAEESLRAQGWFNGPKRLRERRAVKSKQRVLEECQDGLNDFRGYSLDVHLASMERYERVLRAMSLPYVDHPEFRAEWIESAR